MTARIPKQGVSPPAFVKHEPAVIEAQTPPRRPAEGASNHAADPLAASLVHTPAPTPASGAEAFTHSPLWWQIHGQTQAWTVLYAHDPEDVRRAYQGQEPWYPPGKLNCYPTPAGQPAVIPRRLYMDQAWRRYLQRAHDPGSPPVEVEPDSGALASLTQRRCQVLVEFVRGEASLGHLHALYRNMQRLPTEAHALRRELMRALETRAAQLLTTPAQVVASLEAQLAGLEPEQQLWVLLEQVASLGSPTEVALWQRALGGEVAVPARLLPEVRDTLVAALAHQAETLRLEQQGHSLQERRTVVGPEQMGRLIEAFARRARGDDAGAAELEATQRRLPPVLRQLIERQADWSARRDLLPWDTELAPRRLDGFQGPLRARWQRVNGQAVAQPERIPDPRADWERVPAALINEVGYVQAQTGAWSAWASGLRGGVFIPGLRELQPAPAASLLELARGAALRPGRCVDAVYAPFLHLIPEGEPPPGAGGCAIDTSGWPPSLRSVLPRLLEYPDFHTRRQALPWLLLEYLADTALLGGDRDPGLMLSHLQQVFTAAPELALLYSELAPSSEPQQNLDREVYGPALDNLAAEAMAVHAPRLLRALARPTTQRLEAIDRVVAAHPRDALSGVQLVGVQHVVDVTVTMVQAMLQLGADAATMSMLGVPYSTCNLSAAGLRALDVAVDTRYSRLFPYHLWREAQAAQQIRRALRQHAVDGKPIVALDDGGYLVRALHRYFPDQAHLFTVVEQTTHGLREAQKLQPHLRCRVINVAKARAKKAELPGVRGSLQRQVTARLRGYQGVAGPAVVLGFGWIGECVAESLSEMGRALVIVDRDPEVRAQARAWAEARGIEIQVVATPDAVIHEAAIIAGCTGEESLSAEQLRGLQHGPVVFSCSSADVEFGAELGAFFHNDVIVHDGDCRFTLLGGGFPINFDGARVVSDPAYLQFTKAALLEGVLQAVELGERDAPPDIYALDEARQRVVLGEDDGAQLAARRQV